MNPDSISMDVIEKCVVYYRCMERKVSYSIRLYLRRHLRPFSQPPQIPLNSHHLSGSPTLILCDWKDRNGADKRA